VGAEAHRPLQSLDLVPRGGERYLLAMGRNAPEIRTRGGAGPRALTARCESTSSCGDLGLTLQEAMPVTRFDPNIAPYHLFVAMETRHSLLCAHWGTAISSCASFPSLPTSGFCASGAVSTLDISGPSFTPSLRAGRSPSAYHLALPPTETTILYPPCRLPDQPPSSDHTTA